MTQQKSHLDLMTTAAAVGLVGIGLGYALAGPMGPTPLQYGPDGEVILWGSRIILGGLVAALGVTAFVVGRGVGEAAARAADDARRRQLRVAQLVSLIACAGAAFLTVSIGVAHAGLASEALPMGALSLLLAAMGAFAGRAGPNALVGVRTPWNYKSRLAWDRSNRLAGRLFFVLGLVGLIATPFVPYPWGIITLALGVFIAAILVIFESWRVWRTDPDRTPF